MHFYFIPPILIVLVLELVMFVKLVQRFKSPWVGLVAIAGLFLVNLLLYAAILGLSTSQTPA